MCLQFRTTTTYRILPTAYLAPMAGFKTHITTSTILGIGYGAGAYALYHFPISTCVLAGGCCSVSGMLPDIDSDSGRPLRESMSFGAAVVPMMMVDRFKAMGMNLESIILAGGAIYLLIRFGLAAILKHFTVHRGMFHSLPACAIFGADRFFGIWLRAARTALFRGRRRGGRLHVAFDSRRNLEHRNAPRANSPEKQLRHRDEILGRQRRTQRADLRRC